MPVIDSHHHFWTYSDEEYGWIPPDWGALRRDFLPEDLQTEIAAAGVDGVISVQARQSQVETEWLLSHAHQHDFIRGVVGWLPLIDPGIEAQLDRFAANAKLRGLRHVLQGETDDAYMLRPDFERGVRALTRRGLAYDVLIFERHLPNAVIFADRHPDATLIVDHVAKPRIAAGELEPWAKNIRELARRPHVACKLSGMVTEANVRTWTPESLRPYFEVVLEAFGPGRILFGTDWPVCLAACGYARWKATVEAWIAPLSPSERAAILGDNAVRLYRLP
jgi:L-fuconolactonase